MLRKDCEKLFSRLDPPELPVGLFNKIMARIREEEGRAAARRRAIIFSAGSVLSLIALVPVFGAMRSSLAQSALPQFLLLLFSDPHAVLVFWNDFALSILESLPVLSVSAFLTTVFIFFTSVKFLARDMTAIFA